MSSPPFPRPVFDTAKELIIEILFGEGGDDSKLFVAQLYDAYTKYADSLNIKHEILDLDFGHVVAKFSGNGVWKAFQYESGKHCVQRYPENDRGGRRQTSMISVAILPLPPEEDYKPLPLADIEITTQCGKQNAGGQAVNKTASAVRAVHRPTGINVFINGRSQPQNKETAIRVLTARVHEKLNGSLRQQYSQSRKDQIGDGGRSGKTRTYNFIDSRVTDHRLETKTSQIEKVMDGHFDLILEKKE